MKTLIRLKIEKFQEQGQEYFVPTCVDAHSASSRRLDIQGLVAEGKTIEEAIEIAEDMARILLDLEKEQKSFKYQLLHH